jgi:hypothetical protein
MPNLTFE